MMRIDNVNLLQKVKEFERTIKPSSYEQASTIGIEELLCPSEEWVFPLLSDIFYFLLKFKFLLRSKIRPV
jgi:hypothetical protein